jgi:peptidoglycan/LPS O-acetylase OafA/YrhL
VAASLKATPILYALMYVARREWTRVGVTLFISAVLLAPMLFANLGSYETDPGASFSLYYYISPLAWAVAAGAAIVLAAWLAWRRSEWVWVAASVAVALAAPRTHATYATFLVVGLLGGAQDRIMRRTLGAASGAASPRNPSVRESL